MRDFMPSENLKKLLIETPVDRLVVLAKQKRGITVPEAAKLLGASEQQVEEWTRILEEHGMLRIEFPMAGPLKIVPATIPQAKLAKKVEEFKTRKAEIEMLAKTYSEQSKDAEKQVNLKFVPIENELFSRLKEVESGIKSLGILKGIEKKMESDISEFEREKEKILIEGGELEKRSSEIMKKIDSAKASSQDLAADIGDVLADMEKSGKNAKMLKSEQKNIEAETAALNKEIKIVSMLASGRKETLAKRISRLFRGKKNRKKTSAEKVSMKPAAQKTDDAQPRKAKSKFISGKKPKPAKKKPKARSAAKPAGKRKAKRIAKSAKRKR